MAQLNLTITQEEMQALLQQDPRQFHKNPRKRQPLKERRDNDRIEKTEKRHERSLSST